MTLWISLIPCDVMLVLIPDKISQLEALRIKIQENLETALALKVKVTLVEPKKLERSETKAKRIIDKRRF